MANIQWIPAPTASELLEQSKALKLKYINKACDDELNSVRNQYPMTEQLTWDHQEKEARAYIVDNTTETPLLSAIASARGLAMSEQVSRVIEKADLYTQLAGTAIGKRQFLEDQITAASTIAEVEAITW